MNNPREQTDKLLAELFHEDWSNGPAADFARGAAAHARRRRLRSITAAGVTTGLAAILAFILMHQPRPPHLVGSAVRPIAAYEILSDAELLTQLRDRPLLIVQRENGTNEFVLLEH